MPRATYTSSLRTDVSFPAPDGAPSVDTDKIGGGADQYNASFRDFVPSEDKRYRDAHVPRKMSRTNDNVMPTRVVNEGVEWRSGKDQAVIDKQRVGSVDLLYKRIMEMHKEGIRRYMRAKKFIEGCTKEQLEKPDEKIRGKLKILRKGPPITKAAAKEQAFEQVVRRG